MPEAPPVAAPPEKPPIALVLEAAWKSVKEMLGEDSDRWTAAATSPLAKSSEPARVAAMRGVQQEQLAALIHAALEFQMRMALGVKHGAVRMQQIGPLMQDLAAFAHAVANGTRVTCRGAGCDWKGQAVDAGPTGSCPTCGSSVYPEPAEKKLLGPNGEVIGA